MPKENLFVSNHKPKQDISQKPIVLVFIGNYLPGYKAGGIIRNIVNTVDHLSDQFDFRIITRDRDLGDDVPYPNISLNEWHQNGNSLVYYLSEASTSYRGLKDLLSSTPHDIILLNSFFDPLTIKVLLNRKLNPKGFKPVIVAPFGEFAWASLSQKYLKKIIFIQAAKLTGLYSKVTWRVSSEFEKADLVKVMNIKQDPISITGDLPIKDVSTIEENIVDRQDHLRIVFLSRIAREKNLDYALNVLSKVKQQVVFDIYGPAENEVYWEECKNLIGNLPANVKVNYLGNVSADQVLQIFSKYDLFLFPTGGEAYGNVIAECLTVGTPVLISTETPWRNLQQDELGWDINLKDIDSFVNAIEAFSLLSEEEHNKKRMLVKQNIQKRLFDPSILASNVALFSTQLENNK